MRELTFEEVDEVSGGSIETTILDVADAIGAFSAGAAVVGAEPIAAVGFSLAGGMYLGVAIDEVFF